MPTIYLSPSTQEYNPYVNGGNEEYYMNLIADAMEPYLTASGISFVRNSPSMNAAASIEESNRGNYDFHLALHSNAAGAASEGSVRGSEVYYYPGSPRGIRAAEVFAQNLKNIYPLPGLVRTVPTFSLGEVVRTKAPAILIEFAYHDNPEDAAWIVNNINLIAENTVLSLCEYFGIPFETPVPGQTGYVKTNGRDLLIRAEPSFEGDIIGRIPNGSRVYILDNYGDWYFADYNGTEGYVFKNYIVLNG